MLKTFATIVFFVAALKPEITPASLLRHDQLIPAACLKLWVLWRGVCAAAFWRCCSRAAFGLRRFERFGMTASTCGRDCRGAKCLTSAEQGAAPDRLQLHSFRSSCLLTSLIPLPAAGELGVLPKRAAALKPFWWCCRLCFRRVRKLRTSAFRWARRFRSRVAFGLLRVGRLCSRAAFGFRRRERFRVAASTCRRNYFSAGGLTSAEQGAPPDR